MPSTLDKNVSLEGNKVLWVAGRMMTQGEYDHWVAVFVRPAFSHAATIRGGMWFKSPGTANDFYEALKT